MTISKDNAVSRQDLLLRFRDRVRQLVVSSTPWPGTFEIRPGRTLNAITGGHVQNTVQPPEENFNNVQDNIISNIDNTSSFIRAVRDIMEVYARNNRISFRNLGNSPGGIDYWINSSYQPGSSNPNFGSLTWPGTGVTPNYPANTRVIETNVARSDRDNGAASLVRTDVDNAANSNNLRSKDLVIDSSDIENFFNACRNIWVNRCNNISLRTYDYNYCHGSFNSHSSHSSRGRR
jgi:hypothetical protein